MASGMSSQRLTGLPRIRRGWLADPHDWKPHLRPGADRSSDSPPAAGLAQLVEHLICNQRVGSSSLSTGTRKNKDLDGFEFKHLAVWKHRGSTVFPLPTQSPMSRG